MTRRLRCGATFQTGVFFRRRSFFLIRRTTAARPKTSADGPCTKRHVRRFAPPLLRGTEHGEALRDVSFFRGLRRRAEENVSLDAERPNPTDDVSAGLSCPPDKDRDMFGKARKQVLHGRADGDAAFAYPYFCSTPR